MNTLNLFHIIFREVVHTTEWIPDSLNSPQGCTGGTNASDSQQALLSTCTKRRYPESSHDVEHIWRKISISLIEPIRASQRQSSRIVYPSRPFLRSVSN